MNVLIKEIPSASFIESAEEELDSTDPLVIAKIVKELRTASSEHGSNQDFVHGYCLGLMTAAIMQEMGGKIASTETHQEGQ